MLTRRAVTSVAGWPRSSEAVIQFFPLLLQEFVPVPSVASAAASATGNSSGGSGGSNSSRARKSTAKLVEKIGKTLDKISSSPQGKQHQQQQGGNSMA